MNGFQILLLLLVLILGLALGAGLAVVPYRRRTAALEAEVDDVGARLGEAAARLAGADAERNLLRNHNERLTARQSQDGSVLTALAPVAEKLSQVQAQVGLLERERAEQYGQLAQQLREARTADAQLLSTTSSLAAALQSNSARGKWGEVQLRRVVEAAGMLRYVDFVEQARQSSGEQSGRPDMVVTLPGNKELVLDSKVPLTAFLAANEIPATAGDAEAARRSELLVQHAKAVRAHVDALAARKYWDGSVNSPELVVCFIPVESVLSSALLTDPGLLDYAFDKNVALASPVSLLALLKAVAYSWRQDVLTYNAKELFELSRQLYTRLGTMGENLGKLGNSIKSSVERYNAFVGTLESRVMPTARKINAFDPASLQDGGSGFGTVDSTPRVLTAPELISGDTPAN